MRSLFSRLGFRRMDEMEKHIAFQAQRNAYYFVTAALLVWSFYESYRVYVYRTSINLTPCGLLVITVLIQTFSQIIMQRNAIKGDDEFQDTGPLFRMLIAIVITAAIIVSIGAMAVLNGVRL